MNEFFRNEVLKSYIDYYVTVYKTKINIAAKQGYSYANIEPCLSHFDVIVDKLREEGFFVNGTMVNWKKQSPYGSAFYQEIYKTTYLNSTMINEIKNKIIEAAKRGETSILIDDRQQIITDRLIDILEEKGFEFCGEIGYEVEIKWEDDYAVADYYGANDKFYAIVCRATTVISNIKASIQKAAVNGLSVYTKYILEPVDVTILIKEAFADCSYCKMEYDKANNKLTISW